jgi:2-oxo-3-hexenedioate decarboxylase
MDSSRVTTYTAEMLRLADTASTAQPLSVRLPGFTLEDAYSIALEVMRHREQSGWRRAGRKIGFTNTSIWHQYGVDRPMFGYMYDETVQYADNQPPLPPGEGRREGHTPEPVLSLSGLVQPLIEPEVCFKLKAPLPSSDDPAGLLRSVDWIGHGFEIVQCHFPEWQFAIEDTIADGGLHGRYVVGPRIQVETGSEPDLASRLGNFTVTLFKNGEPLAAGGGANVLGSPLNALAHLAGLLTSLPDHPPLEPGELITTGTLTDALPVSPGETWSTRIEGLELAGTTLRFT